MLQNAPASLPPIVVCETDENRLTTLATGRAGEAARLLLAEMERARIVPDETVPEDVVRMHSVVEFEIDGANRKRVQIVFPGEANIDQNKISILTPIGAALIGLSRGQTMSITGQDGRPHQMTVVDVASVPVSPTA